MCAAERNILLIGPGEIYRQMVHTSRPEVDRELSLSCCHRGKGGCPGTRLQGSKSPSCTSAHHHLMSGPLGLFIQHLCPVYVNKHPCSLFSQLAVRCVLLLMSVPLTLDVISSLSFNDFRSICDCVLWKYLLHPFLWIPFPLLLSSFFSPPLLLSDHEPMLDKAFAPIITLL